ncbi:hypothetical protein Q7P37_008279 [Cladosporium fusiforme]
MADEEVVHGVVAAGAGLNSLSRRLFESAAKLRRLYHDNRNAPTALSNRASDIETIAVSLRNLEQHLQGETHRTDLLTQFIERGREHVASLEQRTDEISEKLESMSSSYGIYATAGETDVDMLLNEIDLAIAALHLRVGTYHQKEHGRRLPSRRTHRTSAGHDYSDIMMHDHSKAHFGDSIYHGDVYITQNGSSSQEKQLAFMQKTMQTDKDDMTQMLSLIIQQTRPRANTQSHSEESNEILQENSRQRRGRKCKRERVAFHVQLRLPFWFSARVWDIARVDAQQGWDLRFRTYNVRSSDAEIFQYCQNGSLEQVQRMIRSGKASLSDVNSRGENLLQAMSYITSPSQLSLARWLLSNDVRIHGPKLVNFVKLSLGAGARIAETFNIDLLQLFLEDLEELEELMGELRVPSIWRECGSGDCLDILLRTFPSSFRGLPIAQRIQFARRMFHSRDHPTLYLAKINISDKNFFLDHYCQVEGATVLHQVGETLRREYHGSDLEDWADIVMTAIEHGADPNDVRTAPSISDTRITYTPLLRGLNGPWYISVEMGLRVLQRWKHMLSKANVDLQLYFLREIEVWRSSHVEVDLDSYLLPNTSTVLVSIEYKPSTQDCRLLVRHKAHPPPLFQLHQLPGSFPRRTQVPKSICWHPRQEESEEGHWMRMESRSEPLYGGIMDSQKLDREHARSYDGLLDHTQDDHGALMRIINAAHRDSSSRERSKSQPAPFASMVATDTLLHQQINLDHVRP